MNNIAIDTFIDSHNDDGYRGTVTPEEAARNIVAAAVYQGVLDYRTAIFDGIRKNLDGTYYIYKSPVAIECERFFDDLNWQHYRKLPDGLLRLRMACDELLEKNEFPKKKKKVFSCPICKSENVYCWTRIPKLRNNRIGAEQKLVKCEGCGFQGMLRTEDKTWMSLI